MILLVKKFLLLSWSMGVLRGKSVSDSPDSSACVIIIFEIQKGH